MWSPTGLVLGPGGIKGFMHLGFLLYMEKHSLLDKIESFVGVSVGAIIALLIVSGYAVYEAINEASKMNLIDDLASLSFRDIKDGEGIISHRKVKEILTNLIVKKFGRVLTMGELYTMTGIELYIASTELDDTNPRPVYFSHKVEPNISCVEAAILSANIPIIFHRLYYKGKSFIDGAFTSPYPLHLVDTGERDVLGIYIEISFSNRDGFFTYLRQAFYSGMVQLRKEAVKNASNRCRHVKLVAGTVDPVGFTTSEEDKIKMVTEGYDIARKFFEGISESLLVAAESIEIIEEV